MKKFFGIFLTFALCLGISGCGAKKDPDSAVVKLSDYPKLQEKSKIVVEEMLNSPSIMEVKTTIKFIEASSNTDNIIALHYETTNKGKVVLTFYVDTAKLQGVTVLMNKEKAASSDDYLALVSATTSISDFNFDADMYDQLGEIIQQMKATKLNDLTVSMQEIDGNMEFSMFYAQ